MDTDGEFCVLTVDMRRWSQLSQPKLSQPRCPLHGVYIHCTLQVDVIEVTR